MSTIDSAEEVKKQRLDAMRQELGCLCLALWNRLARECPVQKSKVGNSYSQVTYREVFLHECLSCGNRNSLKVLN